MIRLLFGLILGLGLSVATPVSARAPGRLVIGTLEFPDILSFDLSLRIASQFAIGPGLRPLVLPTPDLTWACETCETLPSLENGGARLAPRPDGTQGVVVTYRLKPGFWGDGVPVTAKDYLFTIALARTPGIGFVRPSIYADIEGAEAPDPTTLILRLARPRSDYNALRITPLPEHLERPVLERVGPGRYARETLYVSAPATPGLWNGPYRLKEWAFRDHLVWERNPHWTGAAPAFDQVVIRAIENASALEQNLLSGDVDYARGVPLGAALALTARRDPRFQVAVVPSTGRLVVQVNLDHPALKDARVRRALVKALDRGLIASKHVASAFAPADSFLSARDPAHVAPPDEALSHDPAAARALLEAAGWRPGPDRIRRDAAGNRLSLELLMAAGDGDSALLGALLQSAWREIGVDIRLQVKEQGEVYRQARERAFSALAVQSWIGAPGEAPAMSFASASIPTKANGYVGGNQSGYASPEMDDLIAQAQRALDLDARRALLARIQALYVRDLPELPLFQSAVAYVTPVWLTGVPPFPTDISTYRIEAWRAAP